MAQTFTKNLLSASTDGLAIKIAATATPGTLVHTGPTTVANYDEVYLELVNTSASIVTVTIEFGNATAPDSQRIYDIPGKTSIWAVQGLLLKGNATPKTVKVFAGTANVITAYGYVHTITP